MKNTQENTQDPDSTTPQLRFTEPLSMTELRSWLALPIHEAIWLTFVSVEYDGKVYRLDSELSGPEPQEGYPDGRGYYFVRDPEGDMLTDTYCVTPLTAWGMFDWLAREGHLADASEGGE